MLGCGQGRTGRSGVEWPVRGGMTGRVIRANVRGDGCMNWRKCYNSEYGELRIANMKELALK